MTVNHDIIKIPTADQAYAAFFLYGVLVVLLLFHKRSDSTFMDAKTTDQLKGLAIVLVVIGHLAVHAMQWPNAVPVLGTYAVSLFFVLSGYGLARSYLNREMQVGAFIKKRVSRVLIPYWLITIVIILTDFILSTQSYTWQTICFTFLAINISEPARHIDYVRWYITALLLWYCVFCVCWKTVEKNLLPAGLIIVGVFIVVADYYYIDLGYNYLSFPAGVVLGFRYDGLKKQLAMSRPGVVMAVSAATVCAAYLISSHLLQRFEGIIPSIGLRFGHEGAGILFSYGIILFTSAIKNRQSYFMTLCGRYSYEIFLIHGPLMMRFDAILYRGYLGFTFWGYMAVVIAAAAVINKLVAKT